MQIMVADDERLERDALSMMIKQERFEVSEILEAKNGLEAVELAREKHDFHEH